MQLGSIESVLAAVQEDARAENEQIERETAAAIARAREEDARLPVVVADAEARVGAARRQARDRLAAEDWADHEAAIRDREAWIAQVVDEGERRLAALDPVTARSDIVRFAREAFDCLPDQPLELLVPPRLAGVADLVRSGTSKPVARVTPSEACDGGCIAQTVDGRIRFDNTYRDRRRRFEAIWRARLGDVYGERDAAGAARGALLASGSER
jgi:vacuolar-type H+-ATPase subunit E/Vma4